MTTKLTKKQIEKLRKGIQNALGKAVAENIDKAVNDVVDTFILNAKENPLL